LLHTLNFDVDANTHEETDETPVLYNSKDKYFLLKEQWSQNRRLAWKVTPRVVGAGRDIGGEGMRGWMAWDERTDEMCGR
jgi:hypothetical protein